MTEPTWTVRRRGHLRRRLELHDHDGALVGKVTLGSRSATATQIGGSTIEVDVDHTRRALSASRDGQVIARVRGGRLIVGDRRYRWSQPLAKAAPVTVTDDVELLLELDRPAPCGAAPITGPLTFPEPFVVGVLAAIAATHGGLVNALDATLLPGPGDA